MFYHGHLMGQGVNQLPKTCSAPAGPRAAATTQFWGMSPHPGAAAPRAHQVRSPSRSCAPSPAPGWPRSLVPCLEVPAVAPWRAQRRGQEGRKGQSRAARGFLPVSWPSGRGRNKTPPFPPFQRERAVTFDTGPSSGRAQCPSLCLPALGHALLAFLVPSCPSLAGISLGSSSWEPNPFTGGVPRWDIPPQQDCPAGDRGPGAGSRPSLLCWWLLGHRTLLASILLLSALLSPLGGFPAGRDVPKAG